MLYTIDPLGVDGDVLCDGERFKRLSPLAPFDKAARVHWRDAFTFQRTLKQRDDPAGLWIGQRFQERRVDEAEDRCVCADAERDRRNRDGREPRAPPEKTQRVAHVLPPAFEDPQPARVAALLFSLLDRAHLTQGRVARVTGSHSGGDVIVRRCSK